MRSDPNATTLYAKWNTVLARWVLTDATDRQATVFTRPSPRHATIDRPSYWNVTIDAFDGQQYGMVTLRVQADTDKEAETVAIARTLADGFETASVIFTRQA